ncbi:MAG: TIGR01212 family radical SAM protein [Pseudomonadota bacterium]
MTRRYNDFNTWLKEQFGERVQKITVDAGFSCPNRDGTLSTGGCIYCNPKGSGTGAFAGKISITDQLLQGKEALGRRYKAKKFFAYFQSFTNTYGPVEKLKSVYEEALAVDDIIGLSIGTRPDCVNQEILDLLEQYARQSMIWIEYGLQSIHDRTLDIINRGHDFPCFQNAVLLTQNRNIKICVHVILGLPGETRAQMLETAEALSRMNIDGIKLHLLYVIKGTGMETLYRAGTYQCLEQQEYVDLVCDFLERTPWNVVIQRLTGDPHPHELTAPEWSLKKAETLAMIHDQLEKRNTRQGSSAVS